MKEHKSTRAQEHRWLLALAALLVMAGCVGLREGARGFRGISTALFEDAALPAASRQFDLDYGRCRDRVLEVLRANNAYVYRQDERAKTLAVYVSAADTTPVGIAFKELDGARTQIEVVSPSVYARDHIVALLEKGLKAR